ncbi:MAG: Ig-like domain-containing protein, partial [Prevotellaceae bacterium]|nr:Ig-like domain-containing protein [Prevotellaceae bacterium]
VQIKGYADDYSKKISFYATAKKLTIDWGDGQKEEITPNGNGREFSHEYENATNFQTISINTEDLTEIGFRYNYGYMYDGDIYELRFGNCPKLKKIDGLYNDLRKLTVFEINRAESLEQLSIYKTDLTELNLNGCINLKSLNCSSNGKLTSLDVSRCTKLKSLDCSGNQLTSLNVSGCTNLITLECSDNQLSATALNSLFTGLPVRTAADNAMIRCWENPGYESCNTSIATNKGWYVYYLAFVEPTGVTLNKTTLALAVGETETLTATVTPANATDKTVTWTSSAPAVATVDDGLVTAVAKGEATITVTTANGKTATCALTLH